MVFHRRSLGVPLMPQLSDAPLNDLSPAATYIAHNYNTPVNSLEFERETNRILKEVEKECAWMFQTKHSDGRLGTINYTVVSSQKR